MKEQLIEIYNTTRRAHLNVMHLLIEKVMPEMTVENIDASQLQQTIQNLCALIYFNVQKNLLIEVDKMCREKGIQSPEIEVMILEREKELWTAIKDFVNITSLYKPNSPVQQRAAKEALEKLKKFETIIKNMSPMEYPPLQKVG